MRLGGAQCHRLDGEPAYRDDREVALPVPKVSEEVRQLTYVIAEPCVDVKNKSCVDVCPVSCIYIEDDTVDRTLYINPDECIDCGACEPECPVNAIFEGTSLPDNWSEYATLNAQWFEDKDAVRARINEIKPA